MRWALLGIIAEVEVTFHDTLRREQRLVEGADRNHPNMTKGFSQSQSQLLSNETGGSEFLGIGRLQAARMVQRVETRFKYRHPFQP